MTTYLKYKPAWLQLLIFGGITIGLALAASLVGLSIVAYFNHVSLMDLSGLGQEDLAKPAYAGVAKGMVVVQFFIFALPSLVFAYLSDPKPLSYAGIKKPDRKNFIFLGVVIILCSYLMVEWLGMINQELVQNLLGKSARAWIEKGESDVGGTLQNILDMKNPRDLLVSIFLVGVLAAVGEELFFRGILQRIFIQVFKKPWPGIILTAAIFSAAHGQFLGFLPRMILGIVLGSLYWYSGSLLPAILGHFIFNGLQVVLVYYKVIDPAQETSVPGKLVTITGIAALLIVTLLLNYMRKQSLTSYARVYPPPDHDTNGPFGT
ncbi:MAG TPA: CPBP family intramembrane glutamic endopeptidase [Puia sp.]|nr:CPBP family intramembrane glutamic endopeptidase [Puia sp.]